METVENFLCGVRVKKVISPKSSHLEDCKKKTIHLIFCDEFPVLRRDLLFKTYDLLLQGVDLTHVVHVRSIVPFRGLKKEYYFFRLSWF